MDFYLRGKPSFKTGSKDFYGIFVGGVIDFLRDALQRGSSDVVWCEGEVKKYSRSTNIAEYWNSISNVVFFVFPPVFFVIWRPYAKYVNSGCNVVWALLMLVGAGSFYFHATLSLFGQLLDELAILWVVLVAVATWIHMGKVFPVLTCRRSFFKLSCYAFAVISSILNSTFPVINRVFLFSLGAPIVTMLVIQVRRSTNHRVRSLTIKSLLLYSVAVFAWINDRFACQFWGSTVKFPYLHSIWHVLVFISCYATCVIFAYFDAIYVADSLMPNILYWPDNEATWLGIPYIGLLNPPSPNMEESPIGTARAAFSPPGAETVPLQRQIGTARAAFSPPGAETVPLQRQIGLTAPISSVVSPPGVRLTQEFPRHSAASSAAKTDIAVAARVNTNPPPNSTKATDVTRAASNTRSYRFAYPRADDATSAHSHSD